MPLDNDSQSEGEDNLSDLDTKIPKNIDPHKGEFDWVAKLDKSGAKLKLKELGIKPKGTVKQMRTAIVDTISSRRQKLVTSTPQRQASVDVKIGPVCDQIRKWNLKFDGVRGAVSFLERLSELKNAYNISEKDLLKALPEVLKDKALLWYRINYNNWESYEAFINEFKSSYLSPDYLSTLDEEIRSRTQGAEESVRDFEVAIRTLMRRQGGYTVDQQLSVMYKNLRPEYKNYVRRRDFNTISEMVNLACEYEMQEKQAKLFRPPPKVPQAFSADTAYQGRPRFEPRSQIHAVSPPQKSNVNVAATTQHPSATTPKCWNCGVVGHSHRECDKPRNQFCFRCGKNNRTVATCENCKEGNERGARRYGGQSGLNRATPSN